MSVEGWSRGELEMPTALYSLMQEAEYHLACAEAPSHVRSAALDELIGWLHDLKVFVNTGIPLADSDRSRAMQPVEVMPSDYLR